MKLGNENFKGKKSISRENVENLDLKTLEQCYSKPSYNKQKIYNYWLQLLYNLEDTTITKFGISGYNCNMFSLKAVITQGGKSYEIYITKAKQEIREII